MIFGNLKIYLILICLFWIIGTMDGIMEDKLSEAARIAELERMIRLLKNQIEQQSSKFDEQARLIAKEIESRNKEIESALDTRDKASENLIEQLIQAVRQNKGNICGIHKLIKPLLLEFQAREAEFLYHMFRDVEKNQKYPF